MVFSFGCKLRNDMRISRLLTYDMAIRCLVKVFNNECYYQSTTVTSKLYLVNCMWNYCK